MSGTRMMPARMKTGPVAVSLRMPHGWNQGGEDRFAAVRGILTVT